MTESKTRRGFELASNLIATSCHEAIEKSLSVSQSAGLVSRLYQEAYKV
jgi:hypothetical protein